MKTILFKLLGRGSDLIDVQPVLALFLGGALIAVFFAAAFQSKTASCDTKSGLVWLLYRQFNQLLWAASLVAILLGSLSLLRAYLHHTLASYQHSHGRITEANYNAVQTIWGAEQNQGELQMQLFWEEEVTNASSPRTSPGRLSLEGKPFATTLERIPSFPPITTSL
jgi:hypothetical protein